MNGPSVKFWCTWRRAKTIAVAVTAILLAPGALAATKAGVDFSKEILPLLSDNCFNCHGPDEASRKAKLRLDLHEEALKPAKSGERAIVPGQPQESELIARITTADEDDVMPPVKSGKKLTPAQQELFRRWIAEGAKWGTHWAFVAPVRPLVPKLSVRSAQSSVRSKGANAASPLSTEHRALSTNPIDAFILARLEREGLKPSPEADKITLLRRVTLDLIGLPPTLEEVDAFLADKSADAYEKVVDRLLANPHYGERMALPWLDAARYADSNGFQQDGDTHQWVWRDWVVRALNNNMPFDQFTIEQLAGDLLPDATMDQKIATGFNRCHMLNGEGGAIAEEQRNVVVFDRVDVTATTWLGLTMACAQCHDHKYDPISQRDYYRMFAYFNNVPESGVPSGSGQYRIADPALFVGSDEQMAKLKALEDAAAKARTDAEKVERSAEVTAAQGDWERNALQETNTHWHVLRIDDTNSKAGASIAWVRSGSIFVTGTNAAQDTYKLVATNSPSGFTGIRLETVPDRRLPSGGAGRADSGNAVITDFRVSVGGKRISFARATADYTQKGFSPANVIDSDKASGWAFYPDVTTPHALILQTERPVAVKPGEPVEITLDFQFKNPPQHTLGHFRLTVTTNDNPFGRVGLSSNIVALLKTSADSRSSNDTRRLREFFLTNSPPPVLKAARERVAVSKKDFDDYRAKLPRVMVMSDARPRKTRLLDRGNYETPRDEVIAGTPSFLPALPADAPTNRLGLARWLVSPEHPLTARVQVNRAWQTFFGQGFVKTSENLGTQCEPPSHPELLDWLAVEFRESGWDVKRLHRLIVTSATYRQSSKFSVVGAQSSVKRGGPNASVPTEHWALGTEDLKRALEHDPNNTLLWRGPRFRLPSLILRDVALASSGLLNAQMSGKPVYPYQPKDIWDGLAITKERDFTYPQSKGEDLYRRSLYTFWRRTVAPGNMFDASARRVCTVRTSVTSTPLHALTTLNDVTWVEAGRALAERVMKNNKSAEARLSEAFRRVCARQPSPEDLKILNRMLDRALAEFHAEPKAAESFLKAGESPRDQSLDAVEHASYATVCFAIYNLDEAMTKE